ncbi:MAG TPA: MFS transporter [Caldithrix abyssi]|uniref:MFS transporter n=1 Tax=Caldithrix abyssi TaxID=187145 RepID=A0A7V5UFL6_CALAY|nr:MFS transporter [Caldithrix abyssi]
MPKKARSPWWWVPSLYFAEGIPYIIVMSVSVIMYKRLGVSNTDIALYTSWLYLPWVIKPLWSPLVDILRTKRFWIVTMQLIIGAGLGGVALTIPLPNFFKITLGFMWLLAFSSATHDISADGFYMLGLDKHQQAWFVGVRSTFYRFAMITGQGLLIILAGYIESHTGLPNVDISVIAKPQAAIVQPLHPDSLKTQPAEQDKFRLVSYPQKLEISTQNIPRAKVDSLKNFVDQWNIAHGFVIPEKKLTQAEIEASWWQFYVAQPLGHFIQKHFGVQLPKITSDKTGNVGVVYFYLTKKPEHGQEIVANFGRHKGDKSISLLSGTRLIFNEHNWNQKAMALIQLDPKLSKETSAVFRATTGNIPLAWSITFLVLTALFFAFFLYHKFILPYPASDVQAERVDLKTFFKEFFNTFVLFFKKERIGWILAFLLLYRLGESQLVKLASPFLLDAQEAGGLGLTTGEVGFIYGTIGILFLTIGGLLGGFLAAKQGLKYWLWFMAIAINLPDAVYIYLSYAQPDNFWIINACVATEQFGYGFGFTAYMLYMIYVSEGKYKTAFFAITTGFMALGMMVPGMVSGWLQELIGYQHFFIWVLIATIPGFLVLPFIPLDPEFGKKTESAE